jgi:hypothetical protein
MNLLTGAIGRVRDRVVRDRGWRSSILTSAVVAAVSVAILLAYRSANPNKDAEQFYLREDNKLAYRVMVGCNAVILASIAFNLRFVLFEVAAAAVPPELMAATAKKLRGGA